jgi:hypothetical protein
VLRVLGHSFIAALLDIVNWPVLMLSAAILPAGYQRILLVEHCILRMETGAARWPWKTLARFVLWREPQNLFYRIVCGRALEFDAIAYKAGFDRARIGSVWHWNNPTDPKRHATGVDLDYAIALARRYQ